MKLRPHAFALASSLTTGIVYTLGSGLIKMFPAGALQFTAPLIHVSRFKLFKYLRPFFGITPMNFAIGLVELILYSYFTSFLLAILYNLFAGYYSRKKS